jgi:transposase-like protein
MDAHKVYQNFPTQEDCLSLLESIWWNGKPVCPYCQSEKCTVLRIKCRYHCNTCNYSYRVTVDTLFHQTRIDLQKWFFAIYIIQQGAATGTKLTNRQLATYVGVNKNTACYMLKRIRRTMLASSSRDKLLRLSKAFGLSNSN